MERQDDLWYPRYRPGRPGDGWSAPQEQWTAPPDSAGTAVAPGTAGAPGAPGAGDGGDGGGAGEGELWRPPAGGLEPADEPEPPSAARIPTPGRREARTGSGRTRLQTRTRPRRAPGAPPRVPHQNGPAGTAAQGGRVHLNEDLDLDELDPAGRAHRRAAAKAARRTHPNTRRRKAFRVTAGTCAVLVLVVAGVGTYAYEHLFGEVATESLDSLTHRPAQAKADRFGNVPENILLLGSQTRDGQHGLNLGNSSKLGTDISDTAMLVHINAERKWATVVSIPRDLEVPRPQCQGRLDATQTVDSSSNAMFDLAMNLGGPTCAVATVEQMTGIRIDHFVEITFNAFQSLTNAVDGVTVCVPPPGINDPHYSGLVLGPGLHTVSGAESLAFVRDRHGLENGTDLNRIRMQQMFVTSLFNKLASGGTLGDPITLYKIANAVTSNLTVDTGLDSIDAMVGLAGSVQSLKSHYIQFITVPYGFDPTNQDRVIPGAGFDQVWGNLRQDAPLPGSNAAAAFGTATAGSPSGPAAAPSPSAAAGELGGVPVEVYNGTQVPHLALYASENLKAMGIDANVGYSTRYSDRLGDRPATEVLYPSGQRTQAQALAGLIGGPAAVSESSDVSALTLVVGPGAPTALVRATGTTSTPDTTGAPDGTDGTDDGADGSSDPGQAAPTAPPSATISTESRSGDENICSDLPNTVKYGGRP